MQTFANRLAHYISDRTADDSLPEKVADKSKEVMINAAAVGLAGSAQPEALAVTRFVRDMGGDGRCTVIGMGLRASPVQACLANGLMVRLLEFDDDSVGYGGHPAAVVFPVVMALAELERCSGRQVLNAFTQGCEIISKLGANLGPVEPRNTNPDCLFGALGAAAAAGMLLKLDPAAIATALEIAFAGTLRNCAGLNETIPPLGYGQMAAAGVTSALLARASMPPPFAGIRHDQCDYLSA